MSKPLALLYYSNLLPGSQLASRLQDLGYRVQTAGDPAQFAASCEAEMPLVVIAELEPPADVRVGISKLRGNPATQHIPVLGFSKMRDTAAQNLARDAGVTLLAADTGITEQLPQLLEQILAVE